MADEFVQHPCARCAVMQKTCCQRAEILVTEGDLGRIERATGRRDFVEFRRPLDPAYATVDPEDPRWLDYTMRSDGTRRMLVRRADGDCTFLGPRGCVLDVETRPLVCRLYPFAYTESGLEGVDDEYCPPEFVPAGSNMPEVLGMHAHDAARWHHQLYDELREAHRQRDLGLSHQEATS